ncbi:MAG: excinuclease ABC subunit UvrC [Bacteroidia bacterium]|nr:excinuclease ABC subunit UvrC [Bacteroidia bacterium]
MEVRSLDTILKTLPDKPGVYQYFDKEGKILYVGKAKSLKKRVSSYFNKQTFENGKTAVLVRKIDDIRFTVVDNPLEALLLENSLIKKLQPRYNVMLKDDKTYPWIVIKNEAFPRIFPTRRMIKDGSEYFGPYASVVMMKTLLDLIKQLYPRRTCPLNLTKQNIQAGKFRVCLEYHIGNCKAPCVGKQSEAEYAEMVQQVREIIKGNLGEVLGMLKSEMKEKAANLEFEQAQKIKEKIDILENFQGKSTIVNPSISNVDVFGMAGDESYAFVHYMKVTNGAIVQTHTVEMKKKLDETKEELLLLAMADIREKFRSLSKEVLVPFLPEMEFPDIHFNVPQRGDKRKLLELSQRNAEQYQKDRQSQIALVDPERHSNRIMERMMQDLRMKEKPTHIECFDNSNIQGTNPVSAMTVFKNGKPSKKDYRHFNIRTVVGPNDFASMEEVIFRRYKRVLDEGLSMPQLIVIDGGKGQLSSAVQSLSQLGLMGKVTVIGIAKKLEEIYFPNDSLPLYLDKRSETLKIIQQIRDEAHRFGITHHRSKRNKSTLQTELTQIQGISDKTAEKLLVEFRSVKGVSEASSEELYQVVGQAKAKLIREYFDKKQG